MEQLVYYYKGNIANIKPPKPPAKARATWHWDNSILHYALSN